MKVSSIGLMLLVVCSAPLLAQEQDEKPLKELSRAYVKAWNGQKAAELAALYAMDAIVTSPDGETVRGREAIQKGLETELGARRKIALSAEEYRWLSDEAVAWRYEWKLSGGGETAQGTGLANLIQSAEGWRIVEDLTAMGPAPATAPAAEEHEEGGDHGHDHGSGSGHGHDH